MQPETYDLTHLLAEPGGYPLDQTRIVVLCNPDNPTGHVASSDDITRLLELALAHKFLVLVDEAYLDTWFEAKPDSALTIAHGMGSEAVEHLAVTHSLSKRSGLAQLRSGMMAGGNARSSKDCADIDATTALRSRTPFKRQAFWRGRIPSAANSYA